MSEYRPPRRIQKPIEPVPDVPRELWREARAFRRISLLIERARQDCGTVHPELDELADIIDRISAVVSDGAMIEILPRARLARDFDRIEPLVAALADGVACCDGKSCDVLTGDIVAELRELRQRLDRTARVRREQRELREEREGAGVR